MAELVQLILELSNSVMEIPTISVAGICLLNTLNLLIVGIVGVLGAHALVYSLIHVKTGQITSMFPVAVYFNPTSHFRRLNDVIHHPCDLVGQETLVPGDMLKLDIDVYQKIPNTLNSKPINNPTNRIICGLLKFGNPGVESRPQSSFIACCLGGLHPVRAPDSPLPQNINKKIIKIWEPQCSVVTL